VGVQLDLFLDSRAVMLANEAVGVLAARDAARAAAAIDRLRREAFDHPALPALEALSGALAGWRRPDRDPAAIVRAVEWLDNEVAPAAEQVFGSAAQAFIAGFFRDLANAAQGLAYEPERATAHRAWLCLQCGEWAGAEEAALTIPGSAQNPDALHWLCAASYRLHGLEHPVVGKDLSDAAFPDVPAANAARLLVELVELERKGNQQGLVGQRERLRRLNPELFSLYMARRAVQYL